MKITKVKALQIETPRYYGHIRGFQCPTLPCLVIQWVRPLYSIPSEGTHPSGSQPSLPT